MSEAEQRFSSLQLVDEVVQLENSAVPACCLHTGLEIADEAGSRDYTLGLPLRSHKPNETPLRPPQNLLANIMGVALEAPFFQVLTSAFNDGKAFAGVTVEGTGPAQCPPGQTSRVVISGAVMGAKEIPTGPWQVALPAALVPSGLDAPDAVDVFHPFLLPQLPAQVATISVPGCKEIGMEARVAVFPDARWSGSLRVSAEPAPESKKGFKVSVEGDLACEYGGTKLAITTLGQAQALCPWFEVIETLAKSIVAMKVLLPSRKNQGLDSVVLSKGPPLNWDPWPALLLEISARLTPQVNNGLLAHSLRYVMRGDPLIAARGELGLLPSWMDSPLWRERLGPLLVGTRGQRIEEITQEMGLYLTARGSVSINASVALARPEGQTEIKAQASGKVALCIEGRSTREYETIVVRGGSADEVTEEACVKAVMWPPPPSPMPDPSERKCRSMVNFTGYALHSLEKHRPGILIRARKKIVPEGEPQPLLAHVLPARNWPGGDEPAEIPWYD